MNNPVISHLTKEQVEEICKLYVESGMTTKDIASTYGISSGTLHNIVVQYNLPRRGKSNPHSKNKRPICRHCQIINPIGSRFCNQCGKPLLTDKECIVERLEKLKEHFNLICTASRDEYIKDVNDIIAAVEKLEVVE